MNNTLKAIDAIIQESVKMKNAYFFIPPQNAGMRRSYEKYHSHEKIVWTDGEHEFSAEYIVTCSCHNVYAKGVYTKDGKPTTLTAIKNSYKRLTMAQ